VDSQELFDRFAVLNFGLEGAKGQSYASRIYSQDPADPGAPGFRIGFKVEKDSSATVNKAEIRIYNLTSNSRGLAENPKNVVELFAGYGKEPKLIFRGNPSRVISSVGGPDSVTTFEVGDGLKSFQNSRVDVSFKQGTPVADVFQTLTNAMGLARGEQKDIPQKAFPGGLSLSGPVRDHMNYLTGKLDLEWSIQNGAVQILPKGKSTSQAAFLLSSETGLIGSPNKKDKGLEVVSLLQPEINPGRIVEIKSKFVNGQFRVEKVSHEGDTADTAWFTRIEIT
jgi:hypothetical protein